MPRHDLDNVMGANFAVMVVVKSSCGMIVSLFERVFEWWIVARCDCAFMLLLNVLVRDCARYASFVRLCKLFCLTY